MSETVKVLLGTLGGALVGLVGTIILALFNYRSASEDRLLERGRMQADIENNLRDDLLDQYETVKEQRDHYAEKIDEFTEFAKAAEENFKQQAERLDRLTAFISEHPEIGKDEAPDGLHESSEDWPDVPSPVSSIEEDADV